MKEQPEGMYLRFDDGMDLDLSNRRILDLSEKFWSSSGRLPRFLRDDPDFQVCEACPMRGQNVLCSALKPLLPFLEFMDRYMSYESLTAVYVDERGKRSLLRTTAADALQFIAHLGLFQYCEYTKKFAVYFRGIEPLFDPEKTTALIALNAFWINEGDPARISSAIDEMRNALLKVGKAIARRLGRISLSDAFVNAFVSVQTHPQILALGVNTILRNYFKLQEPGPAGRKFR